MFSEWKFKLYRNQVSVYLTIISLYYISIPSQMKKTRKETTLHRHGAHHVHTRDKQAPTHVPLPSAEPHRHH
jgi:hypothetical protein